MKISGLRCDFDDSVASAHSTSNSEPTSQSVSELSRLQLNDQLLLPALPQVPVKLLPVRPTFTRLTTMCAESTRFTHSVCARVLQFLPEIRHMIFFNFFSKKKKKCVVSSSWQRFTTVNNTFLQVETTQTAPSYVSADLHGADCSCSSGSSFLKFSSEVSFMSLQIFLIGAQPISLCDEIVCGFF